jgi:hypothetical protein
MPILAGLVLALAIPARSFTCGIEVHRVSSPLSKAVYEYLLTLGALKNVRFKLSELRPTAEDAGQMAHLTMALRRLERDSVAEHAAVEALRPRLGDALKARDAASTNIPLRLTTVADLLQPGDTETRTIPCTGRRY